MRDKIQDKLSDWLWYGVPDWARILIAIPFGLLLLVFLAVTIIPTLLYDLTKWYMTP